MWPDRRPLAASLHGARHILNAYVIVVEEGAKLDRIPIGHRLVGVGAQGPDGIDGSLRGESELDWREKEQQP